jgi:hypothetical protein
MARQENPAWTALRTQLQETSFAPGDTLQIPDMSLLDEVGAAMRTRTLQRYEVEPDYTKEVPFSLEGRFRDATPDDFNGSLTQITLTVLPPDLSFIAKAKNAHEIDPQSVIQFSISSQAHVTGYGDIGDIRRIFVMLSRKDGEGNHTVSLLSGRVSGSARENYSRIGAFARRRGRALESNATSHPTTRGFTGGGTGNHPR